MEIPEPREVVCETCGLAYRVKSVFLSQIGKSFETRTDCACTIEAQEQAEREERRQTWRQICRGRSQLQGEQLQQTFVTFAVIEPNRKAYESAVRFCRGQGRPPILVGDYGRGKSHLLAAIVNDFVGRGVAAEFWTLGEILARIRRSYDSEQYTDPLPDIQRAAVLCLDDVGAEKLTEWGQEQLCRLADYRSINGLPTCVSTNLGSHQFAEHVGGRTASRLLGQGAWTPIGGPDHRMSRRVRQEG